MSHTIFMAYAGLRSRAAALEVLANNLANAHTAGFKRQQVSFNLLDQLSDVELTELEQAINAPVSGTRTHIDFTQGSLVKTGNTLDLALAQPGFFVVETGQGVRYTRNGGFTLNASRELVTAEGHPVLGEGPAGPGGSRIFLPEGKVQISPSGQIEVEGMIAGQLRIVDFTEAAKLVPEGSSLFRAPEGVQPQPAVSVEVRQGFLEGSNMNPIEALSEMINLMRSFEMLSQTIRSMSNQVDQKAIDEVGRF